MIIFTILVFTCLISAFISCALGFFVLAKNSSSAVNRLFFAMMIGATYWALGEYLLWTATGAEGVHFWLKATAFWPLVLAITAHFILTFTGRPLAREKHPLVLLAILYTPAVIVSLLGLFTDSLYTVGYRPGAGWIYIPALQSPAYLATGIYLFVVMLWTIYTTMASWQRTSQERIRHQSRLVSIGLVMVLVCGCLSWVFFPYAGIYIPNDIFTGIAFFSLLIVYSIQRYGLFTLSPETAVPDILRTMPDGVLITDPEGRILLTNAPAAKILKTSQKNLQGKQIQAILPESIYTTIQSTLFSQGTVSDVEAVLYQGENSVASISGTLVHDPSGEIAGFVLIIRDVTDRRAAEKALQVANEKISILSQMTRHDVSNLLTALSGYLDLLMVKNDNPENGVYLTACTGILEKISRHLQFSREYEQIGALEPTWQQLDSLITRGIAACPHEGITVTTHIAPVEIYTDPLAFKVMYNLFENAIRHGGRISRFDVWTEIQYDGTLLVVFEDDGLGVSNENKKRIFEYGFGSHTGIGLSLARDILLMTGIWIAETGKVGKGARFEISVPRGAWRSPRPATV